MPRTNIFAVLQLPAWQNYLALPVVDRDGVLLGELKIESILSNPATSSPSGDPLPAKTAGKSLIELYTIGIQLILNELHPTKAVEHGNESRSTPITARQDIDGQ